MSRTSGIARGAILALVLSAASARAEQSYSGSVIVTRSGTTVSCRATMSVDKWMSGKEGRRFASILKDEGEPALLVDLRRARAGRLSTSCTPETSWRILLASGLDAPAGRIVRLVTDRPITIVERPNPAEGELGAVELVLGPSGPGLGVVISHARVEFDGEGRLVVDSLSGAVERLRMSQVVLEPRKLLLPDPRTGKEKDTDQP
ncbi:MAG TPA: hypothetical protein VFM88_22340 [Vicinamibacteria bacterium]|nr:hypothetical protein [Vicinamibacteria bacterium]